MKASTFCCFFGVPALLSIFFGNLLLVFDVAYIDAGGVKFDKLEKLNSTIPGNCRKYLSGLPGHYESEDIVRFSDDLFLFSSGDMHVAFQHGLKAARGGGRIFLFDLKKEEIFPAIWRNWPKNRPFHPLGVFLSRVTNRYYVINHSGLENEHSVVEVFNVINEADYPSFNYIGSIKGGFKDGSINDVIENGADEIFVTEWKPHSIHKNGDRGKKTFWEHVADIKFLLSQSTGTRTFAMTGFYFCRFDINNLENESNCIKANKDFGYLGANGIAIDKTQPNKNTFYIADPAMKDINVYQVPKRLEIKSFQDKDQILRQIKHIGSIATPDSIDNLDFDEDKGVITAGGVPAVIRFFMHMHGFETFVPGSMLEIDIKTWKVQRKFYHDGSLLSEIAICVYNTAKSKEKAICGSPFYPGVLVCDVP